MRQNAAKSVAAADSNHKAGTGSVSQQKASIYQTIADIDDIRELLDLPGGGGGSAGGGSVHGLETEEGRDSRSQSIDSLTSNSSEGSSKVSESSQQPSVSTAAPGSSKATTASGAVWSLEDPVGSVVLPSVPALAVSGVLPPSTSAALPAAPIVAAAGTRMGQVAVVQKSDSSHLLELEDFFSELNTGTGISAGKLKLNALCVGQWDCVALVKLSHVFFQLLNN